MKYLILSVALLFSVTAFAHSHNGQQENKTSSTTSKTNQTPNSTVNQNNQTGEEEVTKAQLTLMDNEINSVRKKLTNTNTSVRTANSNLNTINSDVDTYRKHVLQYAGDLLNIPYSDYIISEIGIPIFKNALNDGEKTSQLETTLTFLENYKANTNELKNILQGYRTSLKSISGNAFPEWAEKTYVEFKYLPLVKQYKQAFPESFDKTYLGGIINKLEVHLQSKEENTQLNMSALLDSLINLLK